MQKLFSLSLSKVREGTLGYSQCSTFKNPLPISKKPVTNPLSSAISTLPIEAAQTKKNMATTLDIHLRFQIPDKTFEFILGHNPNF